MKILFSIVALTMLFSVINAQEATPATGSRILIAMEPTEFKKKLVASMKTLLEQKSMQVTIVENSEKELQSFKSSDYDVVFITNSGVWSKVRPWITAWIDSNKADSAKILLHTTKKLNWEEDVYVDAVSSASTNKLVPKLAEEYVTRLLGKR